nr:putative vacuolar protein sorting-associated protein 13F [Ipomoea batatas]
MGYLGQYIRDIQTEQLKITLWNEEVLLENVELILEAFDYLQFPFALKQGKVSVLFPCILLIIPLQALLEFFKNII